MATDFLPLSSLRARKAAHRAPEGASTVRSIRKKVGRAMADFPMIEAGDRIMVCVSGGKDSYALLDVLVDLARRAPVDFELLAVNIDQGWPGYRTEVIEEHLAAMGVEYRMVDEHFAAVVEEKLEPGQTPCSLCSRLRRGVLYSLAKRWGMSKIALGHHADDLIETLVMNMFYSGKLASMPPVLHSDDGKNTVIRPLAYVPEDLLRTYCDERQFPVVRCGCPSCGLPEQKRQLVKRLLGDLEGQDPGIKQQMLAALRNIKPSHLLDPSVQRKAGDSQGRAF